MHAAERKRAGRNPEPSAAIVLSQSVKTVEKLAAIKGYDFHKKGGGRKRHLLVDTLGLPHLKSYLAPVSGRQYVSAAEVGSMLLIYNGLGLLHALITPLVIGRMKHPYIIALGGTSQIIGYLRLLYEPTLSWVWAVVLAPSWMVCTALFQLINLRTHTTTDAPALSGFVQGVGYIFAGIGPLFVGLLHEWAGGWTVPFWFLILAAAVMMVVAAPSVKHEYLEVAVAVCVKHPSDSAAKTPNIG